MEPPGCKDARKFYFRGVYLSGKLTEAGAKVGETCRKHGISEPTYYAWKNKYAGMDVSQLRHLKDVEVELARLKRMYAELALEHHALKDVLSRKG
jgi:putative transposase